MKKNHRDWKAAQAAATGFLVCLGAISFIFWSMANLLADWAIYPPSPEFVDGEFQMSINEQIRWMKSDYRWLLNDAAFRLTVLTLLYWVLAFALGTARPERSADSALRRPSLWLGLAIGVGVLFAFLNAAHRFAVGPAIDACTRRYHAARPNDPCIDCGIHRCEANVVLTVWLIGLLLMLAFMGWSLWLRRRLIPVDPPTP